jgi:hypothetical protein
LRRALAESGIRVILMKDRLYEGRAVKSCGDLRSWCGIKFSMTV